MNQSSNFTRIFPVGGTIFQHAIWRNTLLTFRCNRDCPIRCRLCRRCPIKWRDMSHMNTSMSTTTKMIAHNLHRRSLRPTQAHSGRYRNSPTCLPYRLEVAMTTCINPDWSTAADTVTDFMAVCIRRVINLCHTLQSLLYIVS